MMLMTTVYGLLNRSRSGWNKRINKTFSLWNVAT
jgi:hypothetical protein